MVWDFAEANLLEGSLSIGITVGWVASAIECVSVSSAGMAVQADAQTQSLSQNKIISTDPPYYDNIFYADLSDFFYVWLRRSLQSIFPTLFSTIAVPKSDELVAVSHRHGGKDNAEKFFLDGMTQAMQRLAQQAHPEGPITIYYAFKQSDTKVDLGTASTGWETFLSAILQAGFQLTGTWPMRTEKVDALKKTTNSLASSVILVCRNRPTDAPTISRREFIRELNGTLPEALDEMTKGSGDEDDFDADTQFCLHWFEQHGWTESVFGEADTLARGKGTSVDGIKEAGVIQSGGGKVRLLKWAEYPPDWDPRTDKRTPIWEALHQLIRALKQGGESASGALLAALGGKAEAVRQLAYRLYTLCERLGQAEDARAYNELITSWTGIESAASKVPKPIDPQGKLFDD